MLGGTSTIMQPTQLSHQYSIQQQSLDGFMKMKFTILSEYLEYTAQSTIKYLLMIDAKVLENVIAHVLYKTNASTMTS